MSANYVREIPGRGRCIVAGRSYAPGELVLCEEPYAMVPTAVHAEVSCAYCCELCPGGTMYSLGPTSISRYCSEKCISTDYPLHGLESPTTVALQEAGVQGTGMDAMRLVFRAACQRKHEPMVKSAVTPSLPDDKVPLIGRSNMFKHLLLLEANTKSVTPDAAREVSRTAAELAKIAGRCFLPLSAVEARSLLYSIQCNAHQILSHEEIGGPKGVGVSLGLFPYTSMMNHSCNPNCVHTFWIQTSKPPQLRMRAIKVIAKGEELCYSYVNLYQSTAARRQQLLKAYAFHCVCERCTVGEQASELELTDSHINYPCESSIFISDGVIDQLEGSPDEAKVAKAEGHVLSSLAQLRSFDSDTEVEALGDLLFFLQSDEAGMFHPAHHLLFSTYHAVCLASVGVALKKHLLGRNEVHLLRCTIGMGLIAMGCMRKYVRSNQSELGHLESKVLVAVELLEDILSLPTKLMPTGNKDVQIEFPTKELVLDFFFDAGYMRDTHWGLHRDERVRDLVEKGGGLTDYKSYGKVHLPTREGSTSHPVCTAVPTNHKNPKWFDGQRYREAEGRLLHNMAIKMRLSSDSISFINRAGTEDDD